MRNFLPLILMLALPALALAQQTQELQQTPSEQSPLPLFDAPPRLAISADELAQRKAQPNFAAVRDAAVKKADAVIAQNLQVPQLPAQWGYYYANPQTGAKLRPLSATEHVDPDGNVFSDERTNAAYRSIVHAQFDRALEQVAWAYAYTDDQKYAAEARRLLLQLANAYPNYPKRQDRWGRSGWLAPLGGRRFSQSLEEATSVIDTARAYDLVRSAAVWSAGDHQHVQENYFRLVAQTLLWFNQGINNHQTWYNAGLLAIGNVLEDADLVTHVLTMRGGYEDQLARSIDGDGMWYEGTIAYHFYALKALVEVVDIGATMHLQLHERPSLRAMFEAPLKMAYPDGKLAAINDSDPTSVQRYRHFYQWAAQKWPDAGFDKVVAWQAGKGDSPIRTSSQVLDHAGLAVLRRGQGENAAQVVMDFGPHGGGHGHLDKLSITLFTGGHEWLLDPGRLTYRHKQYKTWVKQTAAHNTVALWGISQQPTTGRLLHFAEDQLATTCSAETDGAYLWTRLRRHVLMTDRLLVDVFDVSSQRDGQIDLLAHASADTLEPVSDLGPGETTVAGKTHGYQHFEEAQLRTAGPSQWQWQRGEAKLCAWLLMDDAAQEQVITAMGIGYNLKQRTPTLIRRRHGRQSRFVTVYDLRGGDAIIAAKMDAPDAASITTTTGTMHLKFSDDGISYRFDPRPSDAKED